MDFETMCNILTQEGTRQEFLIRLKQAGESSPESESLQKIMKSLGMGRTPKYVFDTTIMQHTFQYCEPVDCFTNIQHVCKAWKLAVDTKPRFNHLDSNTMKIIHQKHRKCGFSWMYMRYNGYPIPIVLSKTIKSLKHIAIRRPAPKAAFFENMFNIVTRHACNLKSFFLDYLSELPQDYSACLDILYCNSHETLQKLKIPIFYFPSNLEFPNLTCVDANFSIADEEDFENSTTMNPSNFQTQLQNLVSVAQNLKVIRINLFNVHSGSDTSEIFQNLVSNYSEQFVIRDGLPYNEDTIHYRLLDFVPVKIIRHGGSFNDLASMTYADKLQYLSIFPVSPLEILDEWKNGYKTILQSFPALKGIHIDPLEDANFDFYDFLDEKYNIDEDSPAAEGYKEEFQEYARGFSKESIDYMKSIGIKIIDHKTFKSMGFPMVEEVSKNIPWRFEFYYDDTANVHN